ncbi:UNVERIFIED_CONTAM: CASP-like protein 4A3 [Sesamum calycinum]|uniref:CASP-like protein n=1 Tax=Sesamum calycinum TaxID=2727403 RepID=A0AAW2J147_9LAMI
MENRNKLQTSPAPDSVSDSSPHHSKRDSGEHISLSPPLGRRESHHRIVLPLHFTPNKTVENTSRSRRRWARRDNYRQTLTPLHFTPNETVENISRCRRSHGSFPEDGKPQSPENKPPPAVVSRDVFKEPMENKVVIEEPMAVVSKAVLEEPKAVANRRWQRSLRQWRQRPIQLAEWWRIAAATEVGGGVMAADRNQGWALDSFDRYKEFRYCMSVNVIGFAYSAAQAFDLSYSLATGKYIVQHQQRLRYYFDFAVDQMIAYLLISASSSATIRIDDWQLNWGKDKFPDMATASISMSFLAFVALASSSLISGYALCLKPCSFNFPYSYHLPVASKKCSSKFCQQQRTYSSEFSFLYIHIQCAEIFIWLIAAKHSDFQ